VLFISGSEDEAVAAIGRAVELDPLRALFHTYRAIYSLLLDRPEKAVEHARRSLEVDENFPAGILVMGEALSLLGSNEEGAALIERASCGVLAGYFYCSLVAWVYVRSGRNHDAERLRASLIETAKRQYIPAAMIAFLAAALGDRESALTYAEQAVHERDPNLPLWIRSRYFQSLRSDPRFDRLLGSTNLDR
jgi:tetratricopeptide (TPR) repeat protein